MSSIENTNDISVLHRRLQAVEEENIRLAKPFDTKTIQKITSLFNNVDNDCNNKYEDEQTFRLICKADTSGVFLLGSDEAKAYLKYLQPHCLKELFVFIALHTHVLCDYIPELINRKQNTSSIEYGIPEMEKYLGDTYGLIVYQEQIKLLSRELAGFTDEESNTFLKVLGRMQITKKNDFKLKFLKQGQENGHNAQILEKIWNYWESIAPYVSSKSYVTSLSLLAYQSAYLKAHYPEEYKKLFNN